MANNFQRGDLLGVAWQPAGLGGAATPLTVKSQNLDYMALLFDVTNTRSGGVTARLAGKIDWSSTIEAVFDLDAPPWGNAPFLLAQTSGILAFFISPAKAIQLPGIIEKIHFQGAVENEERYSFDAKCNSLAGVIIFPPL